MRSMPTIEGYGRRHPRFPIAARLAFLGSVQRVYLAQDIDNARIADFILRRSLGRHDLDLL
jgi:hypothetical protein